GVPLTSRHSAPSSIFVAHDEPKSNSELKTKSNSSGLPKPLGTYRGWSASASISPIACSKKSPSASSSPKIAFQFPELTNLFAKGRAPTVGVNSKTLSFMNLSSGVNPPRAEHGFSGTKSRASCAFAVAASPSATRIGITHFMAGLLGSTGTKGPGERTEALVSTERWNRRSPHDGASAGRVKKWSHAEESAPA